MFNIFFFNYGKILVIFRRLKKNMLNINWELIKPIPNDFYTCNINPYNYNIYNNKFFYMLYMNNNLFYHTKNNDLYNIYTSYILYIIKTLY